MEKNYQTFIGIDVSKEKLDYCIVHLSNIHTPQSGIIDNDIKSINGFIRSLKKQKICLEQTLFCMENTGVYSMPLCYALQSNEMDYWVVPALEIKRSKGICRGKTDRTDAKQIADYALTHLHQLKLSTLPEADLLKLRLLLAEREKLIKSIAVFTATKEQKNFLPKELLQQVLQHNRATVLLLKKQLKKMDDLIDELIKGNETFQRQDELLQSIPGIGRQNSVILIAYTQSFSLFDNARQFACYAGVAPFEYSSGSSIRGKTKVSSLANKKIKAALNMAALAAKKFDPQLKQYFERKVKEGKNKMSVLNAVRCKLIGRAFAVIHRGTPYVNIQKFAA